ncbi:MAG: hypothetical protein HY319_20940, partial [Armatimonadetes bacterium]|nr:hypothetical protein [Armatimonadota bacterium]
HWDHIQGFPFFAPAYSEKYRLKVHSVRRPHPSMRDLLSHQQDVNFFPVPLSSLESHLEFVQMEEAESYSMGPFRVSCRRLNHPGITAGFRIEHGDDVVAYVSDVAPSRDLLLAEHVGSGSEETILECLYENQLALADRATVVIYDTFFTPDAYQERKHWGHSTTQDAVEACKRAGARHLFLFHHNPDRNDQELATQLELDRALYEDDTFTMGAATEGCTYRLTAREVVPCG